MTTNVQNPVLCCGKPRVRIDYHLIDVEIALSDPSIAGRRATYSEVSSSLRSRATRTIVATTNVPQAMTPIRAAISLTY